MTRKKQTNLYFPPFSVMLNVQFETDEQKTAFINDAQFAEIFSKLSELAIKLSPKAKLSSKTNP
jgi:hypothetical protein